MTNDILTNEQIINLDNLNYYFNNKINVHIKLLRTDYNGKNIFLNGLLIEKHSNYLFTIKEQKLGQVRIHLLEIKANGISKLNYEIRKK